MLAVPSSRVTLRSCPEGTISDTKPLIPGPVIFVKLQEVGCADSATNCEVLPAWVHFVSLTHECWNQSNYFKSVKWSMCEKALCRVLLVMLQANLQVQCCSECDNFKPDFHSEQKLTWR